MTQQNLTVLQYIVAGGTAGGVESLVSYPTEYVKTKQQLSGRIDSPLSILSTTVRHNGFKPIFTGSMAFALSNSSKAAVRFVTFELVRARMPQNTQGSANALSNMLAGLCAGIAESVTVLTPGENIKTKMIDRRGNAAYTSMSQTVAKILSTGGFRGLYRGVVPVTMKQSANAVVRFTSYQFLLARIRAFAGDAWMFAPAMAGGMAGIVTVYATMPFDNIKTRLQATDMVHGSSLDCVRGIIRQNGVRGLWRGTTPRLIRLTVSGALTFSIYEQMMTWMNLIDQVKL